MSLICSTEIFTFFEFPAGFRETDLGDLADWADFVEAFVDEEGAAGAFFRATGLAFFVPAGLDAFAGFGADFLAALEEDLAFEAGDFFATFLADVFLAGLAAVDFFLAEEAAFFFVPGDFLVLLVLDFFKMNSPQVFDNVRAKVLSHVSPAMR